MKNSYSDVNVGSKEDLEADLTAPYDVVLTAADWTVETILSLVRKGIIDMNPSFQRREAWNKEKKSFFIESILLNIPIPQIILAEKDRKFIVVDGRQRLLTLMQFTANENDPIYKILKLNGLKKRPTLNGKSYNDIKQDLLDNKYADDFDNSTIRTAVLKQWNNDALYDIFLRINQGSVILSPQELRQALYPGEFTAFVQDASGQPNTCFRKLLNNEAPDPRMRDAELLLRFYALKNRLDRTYNGNLKDLLDGTCEYFNKTWQQNELLLRDQLAEMNNAYDFAIDSFEELNPFCKYDPISTKNIFNRAIFDFIIYYFSDPVIRKKLSTIVDYKIKLQNSFKNLFNDTNFVASISTSTKNKIEFSRRMTAWADVLSSILGHKVESPL